ncbi:hypothetical protein DFJ74DRAFT_665674 [Hyaloraphidium curvatum]|nr:hypothetical protein DFJ74DRAFT_665674 [Hyaloraphidium curvatum]
MRADFARLAYMHERGGAYADLDVEIVGNLGETLAVPGSSSRARLDALGSKACRPGRAYPRLVPDDKVGMLAGGSGCRRELVLASMGDPADVHWWPHALPNAFMASVPGHPFWAFAAGQVARLWREKREGAARELGVDLKEAEGRKEFAAKMEEGVEYVTGPGMLAHAVFDYVLVDPRRAEGIQLLGPEIVFGYDWQHRRDLDAVCSSQWSSFDREKCLDAVRAGTGTARAFKQPALLELRVVETGGLLDRKRQGVVVEVVEEGRSSIAGTVAVSYWSHSWGDNPAVLQGGG